MRIVSDSAIAAATRDPVVSPSDSDAEPDGEEEAR